MADKIAKILDESLARLERGESLAQVLADYPNERETLEPLLRMQQTLTDLGVVKPSRQFHQISPPRLIAKIQAEEERRRSFSLYGLWQNRLFRPLVPVVLVLVLSLVAWLAWPANPPVQLFAADSTLNVLKGSVAMSSEGGKQWLAASDGSKFTAGVSLKAGPDSYAVLTFFDGSTTTLNPDCELTLAELAYPGGQAVRIVLDQKAGLSWNHVLNEGNGEKPYFEVRTPHLQAVAEGTTFSASVDEHGTQLAVAEGTVKATQGNRETLIMAERQLTAGSSAATASSVASARPQTELAFSTSLSGIGSISDPNGASTGYLPDGLSFNQINSSRSSLNTDSQQIVLRDPITGEYSITVRSLVSGSIPFKIQLSSAGRVIFDKQETLEGTAGQAWLVKVQIGAGGDSNLTAKVVSIGALNGPAPEKVVETDLARLKAAPIRTAITAAGATPTAATPASPLPIPSLVRPSPASPTGLIPTPTSGPGPTVILTPIPAPETPTPVISPTVTQSGPTPTATSTPKPVNTGTVDPTPVAPTPTPTKSPSTNLAP